jgi:hypothetical protein
VAVAGNISVSNVPIEAGGILSTPVTGSFIPGNSDVINHDGDIVTHDSMVNISNDPVLNGNGLAFGSGQYDPNHYNVLINLWGNAPGSYGLFVGLANVDGSGNVIGDPQYVYHVDSGSLNLTEVPEPATYAAILGALALGLVTVRRRKPVAA